MLKRPKILVVGSIMMDVIASTRRMPGPGETVIGMKFRTAPGGKGSNQAVQCARLGAHVTMAGQVGGDLFGRTMLETASAAGVDMSRVSVDENESTGVAHITLEVSDTGVQNRITVCPGAGYTLKVEDVAWVKDAVAGYDMVLMQFELPMPIVEAVARWAHEAGVPVMINPAPAAPMSRELLACADYISPNEHEAAILAGRPIRVEGGVNFDDVEAVVGALRAQGAENVIITLGENGAVAAGKEGIRHTPCVKAEHVADPTAAGDSFVGAFCTGLTAGLSQEQALAFASHAAAITVSRMGAMPSLPTVDEVQKLLRERDCTVFDPALLDGLK